MGILSFGNTYELPLSKNYVRHWGFKEAIREILQNALDSESPFEYSLNEDSLKVHSRFTILSPATLLLGQTSKADSTDTIGSFGEGYKIALLVLLREGYQVIVHNGSVDWVPEFRHSKLFGGEILCIKEVSATKANEGITFEVLGLGQGDAAAIRSTCLRMQTDLGETIDVARGRILKEKPGKLYVGGLFVCDTDLVYGYDVKPEFLRLERDRQTVSSFDLLWLTKEMWFESQRFNDVAELIEEGVKDLEYGHYDTPELIKEACYNAFRSKHPGKVIAKSKEDLDNLVKRGMTNTIYLGSTFGSVVSSSTSYVKDVFIPAQPPHEVMTEWFKANRRNMRTGAIVSFKAMLKQAESWKLK
jgi:hypothetical protein